VSPTRPQSMKPVVIIGAGLSGAVLAERYANILKQKVLVIEKRDHIAGNCYDYVNDYGIIVGKYGAHIFHTNDKIVWDYTSTFCEWLPYQHRVLSSVNGKLVPIPINITTVNKLLGLNIKNETEMLRWLKNNRPHKLHIQNSEDAALALFGRKLYELMFRTYTFKQWGKWPSALEPSVLQRIPIRTNFNDRYFDNTYEGIPQHGYTQLVAAMLSNPLIEIHLNTDFFDVRRDLGKFSKLFYTGPIDRYFDNKFKKLEYRSLRFKFETYDMPEFQPAAVINYPGLEQSFTRIVEYKKLYGSQSAKTTISREYPTDQGEPYYPVPSEHNRLLYSQYQLESKKVSDTYFVGRLANYKYFNMDQAIRNALDIFKEVEGKV
jgi:UDP-galactopyranose mutase